MNGCGPDGGTSSLSVLVVDDNEVNRLYLFHALRKMGFAPVMAEDGQRAIELFSRQPFDVVLMDIQLPDMDGLHLTRIIRAGRAGTVNPPGVPIVALTAFTSRDDRARSLEAGMDDHLAKPVRAADITAAIWRVLGRDKPAAGGEGPERRADFDLAGLTRESGREFVTEMLHLFLELAEPKRQALRRAMERGDIAAAAPLAHDLAGMAGPIRARRLHRAMKAVQEACGAGSLEACRSGHAAADRELAEVLAAVRAHPYLAQRPA
ncbi:response regulator [Solidesulfovibrio sp.]|uniref:response regulator n=1 Tax=Solidesulfovibrio sp. TaxID=2910990 RepID=UPI002B1F18B4|nr:response regulator [Solidesulfovibrio sp.]MEA4855812.1 response regulator [Solidesulfovibrio sp.]